MSIQFETLTAPAHWSSYLVNGDASGLDAKDIAQANTWMIREGVRNIVDCGEEYFSKFLWLHAPECNARHGTVCDYACEINAGQPMTDISILAAAGYDSEAGSMP